MADFSTAQAHVIEREGGYKLVDVEDDRGGVTFAGISRKWWPDWAGWSIIDSDTAIDRRLELLADQFYEETYWSHVQGDDIDDQEVAQAFYSSSILAGRRTATNSYSALYGCLLTV